MKASFCPPKSDFVNGFALLFPSLTVPETSWRQVLMMFQSFFQYFENLSFHLEEMLLQGVYQKKRHDIFMTNRRGSEVINDIVVTIRSNVLV